MLPMSVPLVSWNSRHTVTAPNFPVLSLMWVIFLLVQCVFDDGKSEHRVCIFTDIVLWEGQLLYVADGQLLASSHYFYLMCGVLYQRLNCVNWLIAD